MKISIINGPNLNLLGTREQEVYGDIPFDEYLLKLKKEFPNTDIEYFQSNIEGELVNFIQDSANSSDGIILNAAGYTHTSVALSDAVGSVNVPVIEVHISNILAREEYRHISLIAPRCRGSIFGLGLSGYRLAIIALQDLLINR